MRRPTVRAAVAGLGVALVGASAAWAQTTAPQTAPATAPTPAVADLATPVEARVALLDAAAAWRDTLDAHRAPQVPLPGDQETLILILGAPPLGDIAPAQRAAAAVEIARQQDEVVAVLADLGATVGHRTRVVANTITVRVPAGRAEAVAALAQVATVVPVRYLAPATATATAATLTDASPSAAAPPAAAPGGGRAVRIALIDGGVDPTHPWLGGGFGPTFPILGGLDLIDGDNDPRPSATALDSEAHGTQMAGLILGDAALEGLPPERRPRMVVHRVVSTEPVAGRERPVARTDRVLAALEAAIDPNGDGDPADRSEVVVIGLASSFAGGGVDPVADALAVADRVGASVVVPAGNDGPTLSRPGSLGPLASARTAITVGGLGESGPLRLGTLRAMIGPASASLDGLPLLGPDPVGAAALPVVVLRNENGHATGDQPNDYLDAAGANRVSGALVVVRRGGNLATVARLARAFGAGAVAVWDDEGPATFPATSDGMSLALPTLGLGPEEGEALAALAAGRPELRVELRVRHTATDTPADLASFSSWGPTADGRQKPDLLAPAVARPAALPGRGPDGRPRQGSLTGTSAAAAQVAARVARLRGDRPELGPRAVRSLLVQGAGRVGGLSVLRQGAGRVAGAAAAGLRLEPAIISVDRRGRAGVEVHDLDDGGGEYRVVARGRDGTRRTVTPALRLSSGGRATLRIQVGDPAAAGRLEVLRADGSLAAWAPVVPARPARTPADALGRPQVTLRAGLAEARVRVGRLARDDGRVVGAVLHSLRLQLVPADGGAPILLAGAKRDGDLAPATYRFLIARRDASGLAIPAGVYRLRAIAAGAGGTVLRRESRGFSLR